ncbi:polyprotein [Erysiphe necator associated totivirus 3]|nr:polyprotein [Erysiphe necator associated totivirus 3]
MLSFNVRVGIQGAKRLERPRNVATRGPNQVLTGLPRERSDWNNPARGLYDPSFAVVPSGLDRGEQTPLEINYKPVNPAILDERVGDSEWGNSLDVNAFATPGIRLKAGFNEKAKKLLMKRIVFGTKSGVVRAARQVGDVLTRCDEPISVYEGAQLTRDLPVEVDPYYARGFVRSMDEDRMQNARVLASAFQNAGAVQGLENVARHGIGLLQIPVECTRFVVRLAVLYVESVMNSMSGRGRFAVSVPALAPIHEINNWTDFRRALGADIQIKGQNYVPWAAFTHNPLPNEVDTVRFLRMACATGLTVQVKNRLVAPMCWPDIPDLSFVTTYPIGNKSDRDNRYAYSAETAYNVGRSWCARYATTEMFDEFVEFFSIMYWSIRGRQSAYAVPFTNRTIKLPIAQMQGYIMVPYLGNDSRNAERAANYNSRMALENIGIYLTKASLLGMICQWVKQKRLDYLWSTGIIKLGDHEDFMSILRCKPHYAGIWSLVQQACTQMGYTGKVGKLISSVACAASLEEYTQGIMSADYHRNSGDYLGWLPILPMGSSASGWTNPVCLSKDVVKIGHSILNVEASNSVNSDVMPTIYETMDVEYSFQKQIRGYPALEANSVQQPGRTRSGFAMDLPFMAVTDHEGCRYRFGFRVNMRSWTATTSKDHDRYNLEWWVMLGAKVKDLQVENMRGVFSNDEKPRKADHNRSRRITSSQYEPPDNSMVPPSQMDVQRKRREEAARSQNERELRSKERKEKRRLERENRKQQIREDLGKMPTQQEDESNGHVGQVEGESQDSSVMEQKREEQAALEEQRIMEGIARRRREEMEAEMMRMRELAGQQQQETVFENHPEGETETISAEPRMTITPSQTAEQMPGANPVADAMSSIVERRLAESSTQQEVFAPDIDVSPMVSSVGGQLSGLFGNSMMARMMARQSAAAQARSEMENQDITGSPISPPGASMPIRNEVTSQRGMGVLVERARGQDEDPNSTTHENITPSVVEVARVRDTQDRDATNQQQATRQNPEDVPVPTTIQQELEQLGMSQEPPNISARVTFSMEGRITSITSEIAQPAAESPRRTRDQIARMSYEEQRALGPSIRTRPVIESRVGRTPGRVNTLVAVNDFVDAPPGSINAGRRIYRIGGSLLSLDDLRILVEANLAAYAMGLATNEEHLDEVQRRLSAALNENGNERAVRGAAEYLVESIARRTHISHRTMHAMRTIQQQINPQWDGDNLLRGVVNIFDPQTEQEEMNQIWENHRRATEPPGLNADQMDVLYRYWATLQPRERIMGANNMYRWTHGRNLHSWELATMLDQLDVAEETLADWPAGFVDLGYVSNEQRGGEVSFMELVNKLMNDREAGIQNLQGSQNSREEDS